MEKKLLYMSFIWSFVGLASGVYYREFTKFSGFDFEARQQLGTTHTHFLVLGFVVQLLALVAARSLGAHQTRSGTIFFWFWNVGVFITGIMMAVKGSLVILGGSDQHPAFAGLAGLGHIALAVGFISLFLWLKGAINNKQAGNISTHASV